MAYGSLAFGLLTGALSPDTQFADNDWRRGGQAFGLPLFERENFLKELRVTERLQEMAAGYGKSVAQLALAWVLSHPAVTVGLVGMRNEHELEENIAAVDWRLSDADRAAIDRIFAEEDVPTYANAPQRTDVSKLTRRLGRVGQRQFRATARQPSCKPAGASSPMERSRSVAARTWSSVSRGSGLAVAGSGVSYS